MTRIKHWTYAAALVTVAFSAAATATPFAFPGYGPQGYGIPGGATPYPPQAMNFAMSGGSSFVVHTSESPQGYLVRLFLQGVDPREVSMRVSGNLLVFERATATGQTGMGGFTFGASTFNWSVPLPADADVSAISGQVQPEGIQMFIPRIKR